MPPRRIRCLCRTEISCGRKYMPRHCYKQQTAQGRVQPVLLSTSIESHAMRRRNTVGTQTLFTGYCGLYSNLHTAFIDISETIQRPQSNQRVQLCSIYRVGVSLILCVQVQVLHQLVMAMRHDKNYGSMDKISDKIGKEDLLDKKSKTVVVPSDMASGTGLIRKAENKESLTNRFRAQQLARDQHVLY
ncbi:hypothetical protein J6590_012192 [Homalodisca vitripennis]|nr:hypothetical protein J6590_012192 [Homalodisca vitripennis]